MEWQQLEYFQTVARLQHMTTAARALSISQPALSRSISRLEKELGVPLFERSGRSIVLSKYGHLFLLRVNRMLAEYQEGIQELDDLLHPEHGEVSLGFLHTLGVQFVPGLIRTYRKDHPAVHFQLHQNNTPNLLNQLVSGEIDMCMAAPRETGQPLEWVELMSQELFVIVPRGHRLADSGPIHLKEIGDEPLISFKLGYGLRKIIDDLLREAGISPKISFEGEEVHTIAGLVAAGLGVAIIPQTKGIDPNEIAFVPVSFPSCSRTIGLAWHKERYLSRTAKQFREFVMEQFKEIE
ncbi:LysR family transcriptional regulator [Paenibacillus caui]|uniref:LysR family transcriptional regulator n=1 Tax=Paenibacillus caui TaxID=2873927 RepID=UPI001CA91647|nr:LysR family transcriptional regulator [Paenibacillus caui]